MEMSYDRLAFRRRSFVDQRSQDGNVVGNPDALQCCQALSPVEIAVAEINDLEQRDQGDEHNDQLYRNAFEPKVPHKRSTIGVKR